MHNANGKLKIRHSSSQRDKVTGLLADVRLIIQEVQKYGKRTPCYFLANCLREKKVMWKLNIISSSSILHPVLR
jgi:hypothetical protein